MSVQGSEIRGMGCFTRTKRDIETIIVVGTEGTILTTTTSLAAVVMIETRREMEESKIVVTGGEGNDTISRLDMPISLRDRSTRQ